MNLLNWLRGGKKKEEPKSKLFPKAVRQDNGFYPRASRDYIGGVDPYDNSDNSSSLLTGVMLGEVLSDERNSFTPDNISAYDNTPTVEMGGGDFGGGGSGGSYDTPDTSSPDTSSSDF